MAKKPTAKPSGKKPPVKSSKAHGLKFIPRKK